MTPQDLAEIFKTSGLAEADEETLQAFYAATKSPITFGRFLFPEKPEGFSTTTHNLGNYAINMVTAIQCRRRGDIQAALHYEKIADMIYDELPEYAVW